MMGNLVAESGAGKGQLSAIVEALCRDVGKWVFRKFVTYSAQT